MAVKQFLASATLSGDHLAMGSTIEIRCSECGKAHGVPSAAIGRGMSCTRCAARFPKFSEWKFQAANGIEGPVSTATLHALRLSGAISDESPIWSEGFASWQMFRTVFEVEPTQTRAPSPQPRASPPQPVAVAQVEEYPVLSFADLGLPAEDWQTFQGLVKEGKLSIGVDTTMAFRVVDAGDSFLAKAWLNLLIFFPIATIVGIVGFVIANGAYVLLFGIPLVVVGHLIASAYVAKTGSGAGTIIVLSLGTWLLHHDGWFNSAILAGTVLSQVVTRKLWYVTGTELAHRLLATKEPIFMAAYLRGISTVLNEENGMVHSVRGNYTRNG